MGIFHHKELGLLILRLSLGGLMIFHGIGKLGNIDGSMGFIGGKLAAMGLPEFLSYGVFAGEIIGPLMIIVGLYSRIGALLVFANMAFALLLVHTEQFLLINNQGGWQLELQGFFLFTALALLFLGSGRIALKAD